MPRGNPENLRQAAERKRLAAIDRAERGLRESIRRGEAITFRGVAKRGGVSVDFLYRSTELRRRIEHLRMQGRPTPAPPAEDSTSDSSVLRTLSAQVRELRRQYGEEIKALRDALAAAHGENLQLRRRLGTNANLRQGDSGA